jgi:hypothetical protein
LIRGYLIEAHSLVAKLKDPDCESARRTLDEAAQELESTVAVASAMASHSQQVQGLLKQADDCEAKAMARTMQAPAVVGPPGAPLPPKALAALAQKLAALASQVDALEALAKQIGDKVAQLHTLAKDMADVRQKLKTAQLELQAQEPALEQYTEFCRQAQTTSAVLQQAATQRLNELVYGNDGVGLLKTVEQGSSLADTCSTMETVAAIRQKQAQCLQIAAEIARTKSTLSGDIQALRRQLNDWEYNLAPRRPKIEQLVRTIEGYARRLQEVTNQAESLNRAAEAMNQDFTREYDIVKAGVRELGDLPEATAQEMRADRAHQQVRTVFDHPQRQQDLAALRQRREGGDPVPVGSPGAYAQSARVILAKLTNANCESAQRTLYEAEQELDSVSLASTLALGSLDSRLQGMLRQAEDCEQKAQTPPTTQVPGILNSRIPGAPMAPKVPTSEVPGILTSKPQAPPTPSPKATAAATPPGTAQPPAVTPPPAPKPAGCVLAGSWSQTLERVGSSVWTIDKTGHATESGLGNSTGTASLAGNTLRIDWTNPNKWAGYYVWTLDTGCKSGRGTQTFTAGPLAGSSRTSIISRQ